MDHDVIIGIETHIQLKTDSKMFCSCSADFFGAEPNTHTCPVCLGLPGALPVINKKALEQAMLMGLALGSTVADDCHFDRKNYFYPDLAKGYQISQYDQPLNVGGFIEVDGARIGIIRAHLEEDVGKLNHSGIHSLVDFNKGGVPLLEIVSEPEIRTPAQAKAYVQTLRQLARYIGVNDGNLERGTMRADINISLQEPGKWRYENGEFALADGYRMNKRVEVKNVNSFRAIERAVEYEIKRQSELLNAGKEIIQETRGWDENKGVTTSQRGKEEAHDYRYFPEPDLPPLRIEGDWVERVKSSLPELPQAKKQRFMDEYGLSEYDARLLTEERSVAEWFEAAVVACVGSRQKAEGEGKRPPVSSLQPSKTIANWMLGELARLQNEHQMLVSDSQLLPAQFVTVLKLIDEGKISATSGKELVAETFVSGKDPLELVKERGLEQVSGAEDLEPIVKSVIEKNADVVANFKAGKESALMFLMGQVMKETRGKAKPDVVQDLLKRLLQA